MKGCRSRLTIEEMDMRKVAFLKLLVGVVAFSGVGLLSAGNANYKKVGPANLPELKKTEFRAEDIEKGTLGVTQKDVDVTLKGRVRQDWVGYDKIYTLRASNDDQLSAFRTKASIDLIASYGKQKYGRSAADAMLRLTNYGYWKQEGYYTPFVNAKKLNPTSNVKYDRSVNTLNLLTYVEEAWINLHFGTFFDAYDNWFSYQNHPISLKVGYFPYQLGRGISLGDYPMHIPYLGWASYGYDDTRTNHPGILVHGNINKDISYDLYYSKRQENSLRREWTWETIHERRTDERRKFRGIAKDRELWTASMDFRHNKKWGQLHLQPYGMYVDASELTIEFEGDSSARFGTVGMMANYKKGQFSMNVEVAGQYGHQNVYPIDRNQATVMTDPDGTQTLRSTHVFGSGSAIAESDWRSTLLPRNSTHITYRFENVGGRDTDTGQWIPAVTKNGDQLLNNGSPIADNFNSNVTGNARFRGEYRLDYRGFMGAVDMKWEFETVPVVIAATGTYASGDKYPFNDEMNKRYKAFLPYGDYNYSGKYVKSQIVLEAKKLSRPIDISYHHQYAFNNVEDMSNLAFLGLGTEWRPFEDKQKLLLQSNLLWFWETTTLKKWYKEQPLPSGFEGTVSWAKNESTGVWYKDGHDKGWKTCDDASKMLGTELNFEVQYRPVDNCLFLMQLGCFIPGQLYKDLDGQPNERTKDGPQAYVGNFGLGHDPVWRGTLSLDYRF